MTQITEGTRVLAAKVVVGVRLNIEVVNVHHQQYDIYCGRARRGDKSPLGNPFRVDGSRHDAIENYRHWLWNMIKRRNPEVRLALLQIYKHAHEHGSVRLGCWCAPKACHADVIVNALHCKEVIEILFKREGA